LTKFSFSAFLQIRAMADFEATMPEVSESVEPVNVFNMMWSGNRPVACVPPNSGQTNDVSAAGEPSNRSDPVESGACRDLGNAAGSEEPSDTPSTGRLVIVESDTCNTSERAKSPSPSFDLTEPMSE
jgi:hypothetical protein